MKQQKNYIGWVNDHSGSMKDLARAAKDDYNTSINAVKNAATRESLDTVVSVVAVGLPNYGRTTRQIVVSNPHVLKPITDWPTPGGTPLYDGIGDMINLLESLPDVQEEHVSCLVMITTDGQEAHSTLWNKPQLKSKIVQLQRTGRWTFVFRVPSGCKHYVSDLGVPLDNIQEWETTAAGMAEATVKTTAAVDAYMSQRATGVRGSNSFFVNEAKVDTNKLNDISKEVSLYVVPDTTSDNGIMVSTFILRHRMKYMKGAAFYQLVKTESRVGPEKVILIQDRTTGKVFGGQEARDMLGLPRGQNARVTPTQLSGYNIFIQSTSWNRKLPGGTGVLYYEKLGTPFSQEEIDRFMLPVLPKVVPAVPVSAQLPQVNNVVGRNIKSNMPVTQKPIVFYATRDDARNDRRLNGTNYIDLGDDKPRGQRFQKV